MSAWCVARYCARGRFSYDVATDWDKSKNAFAARDFRKKKSNHTKKSDWPSARIRKNSKTTHRCFIDARLLSKLFHAVRLNQTKIMVKLFQFWFTIFQKILEKGIKETWDWTREMKFNDILKGPRKKRIFTCEIWTIRDFEEMKTNKNLFSIYHGFRNCAHRNPLIQDKKFWRYNFAKKYNRCLNHLQILHSSRKQTRKHRRK